MDRGKREIVTTGRTSFAVKADLLAFMKRSVFSRCCGDVD